VPPLGLIPISRSPGFVICCSRRPHVICIDEWVTVWDALSGEQIRQYRGGNITAFAITSDDRYFAVANNSTLNVWDLQSDIGSLGIELFVTIISIAFAPSVSWIACGNSDNKIRVLKIQSGRLQRIASLFHPAIDGPPKHLEATDSHIVARYRTVVGVWDVVPGILVKSFQIHASLLHISFTRLDPSAHVILDVAPSSGIRQNISIRDSKTSEVLGNIDSPDPVEMARFSRCGGYVISGHFRYNRDALFRVWDAKTTKLIYTASEARSISLGGGVGQVYMSPSRKFVVALPANVGGRANVGGVTIRLWKLELPGKSGFHFES
jgi:WD40 repeat protein